MHDLIETETPATDAANGTRAGLSRLLMAAGLVALIALGLAITIAIAILSMGPEPIISAPIRQ